MSHPDLDRHITAWLQTQAPMREPDGLLERVASDLAHTRRLPGWVIPERWFPMQTIARYGHAVRAATMLVIVALLLAAFAALVVAAQPKPAPPLGAARNGLIAFPRGGDIWVVGADGSEPRSLVATPGLDGPAFWSPDGAWIAFWSTAFDGDVNDPEAVVAATGEAPMAVWVANADGSDARRLLEGVRWSSPCGSDLSWAHDSAHLAVSTFSADDPTAPIISVLSLDGDPPRLLVEQGTDPYWSPDDSTIAYHGMTHVGGGGDLDLAGVWLIGADGSDDRRLSETYASGCGFDGPVWSPDGQRIAFYGQADGYHDIWVVNADGSSEAKVSDELADEYWPRWSPDGTRIAFDRVVDSANNAPQFVVTDPDGSDQRMLDHPMVAARYPTWAPDGEWILGMLLDEGHTDVVGLLLVDPDGDEAPRTIYEGVVDGDPSWQRLAP